MFVCILPEKAVPEMTYIVSGRTLNPTLSLWFPDTVSMLSLLLSEINDITCAVKTYTEPSYNRNTTLHR